jgi:hypothetical protein
MKGTREGCSTSRLVTEEGTHYPSSYYRHLYLVIGANGSAAQSCAEPS